MSDLETNKILYRENFKSLLASVNTLEHAEYSRIERELDKNEVKIMKSLGIYIANPCPIAGSKYCSECTGYFKKIKGKNKEVKSYIEGAKKCSLKDIKITETKEA